MSAFVWEEPMDWMATEGEADREYAHNVGMDNDDRPWILSDRDVWYRNPYYIGPAVPHPEDDIYTKEDVFFFNSASAFCTCGERKAVEAAPHRWPDADDYVPF